MQREPVPQWRVFAAASSLQQRRRGHVSDGRQQPDAELRLERQPAGSGVSWRGHDARTVPVRHVLQQQHLRGSEDIGLPGKTTVCICAVVTQPSTAWSFWPLSLSRSGLFAPMSNWILFFKYVFLCSELNSAVLSAQCLGNVQSLSCGDPVCAPEHATVSQAAVQLLQDLTATPDFYWHETVTAEVIDGLRHLPKLFGIEQDVQGCVKSQTPDNVRKSNSSKFYHRKNILSKYYHRKKDPLKFVSQEKGSLKFISQKKGSLKFISQKKWFSQIYVNNYLKFISQKNNSLEFILQIK